MEQSKVIHEHRVTGTTVENRQQRLAFLKQFRPEDLSVTLEREPENQYDAKAIKVVVHIKPLKRRTVIGYVPKGLAGERFRSSRTAKAGGEES